jgi:hypothetical protein
MALILIGTGAGTRVGSSATRDPDVARDLPVQVLKAPLRALGEDPSSSASNARVTALNTCPFLESPRQNTPPDRFLPASQKHFRSLRALSALVQNQPAAIPPSASPLPPPAR